jgi:hypothetical protein
MAPVDWRIILKLILKKWGWKCGLIHLAQDRDHCCALLNIVMNFWAQ